MLVYVITDRRLRPDLEPEEFIDRVARSGADMIQIREKDLPPRRLLSLVETAVEARGSSVYVNGRVDVALAAGAVGVHLPASGLPVTEVRVWLGGRLRAGVSTHSLPEALAAEAGGADFITFGPVYETVSKKAYGPPVGVARLAEAVAAVRIPVLAIGGIDDSRIAGLAGVPVAGVALISAVVRARDMASAVSLIRERAAG